jgi:hypothetical protein
MEDIVYILSPKELNLYVWCKQMELKYSRRWGVNSKDKADLLALHYQCQISHTSWAPIIKLLAQRKGALPNIDDLLNFVTPYRFIYLNDSHHYDKVSYSPTMCGAPTRSHGRVCRCNHLKRVDAHCRKKDHKSRHLMQLARINGNVLVSARLGPTYNIWCTPYYFELPLDGTYPLRDSVLQGLTAVFFGKHIEITEDEYLHIEGKRVYMLIKLDSHTTAPVYLKWGPIRQFAFMGEHLGWMARNFTRRSQTVEPPSNFKGDPVMVLQLGPSVKVPYVYMDYRSRHTYYTSD